MKYTDPRPNYGGHILIHNYYSRKSAELRPKAGIWGYILIHNYYPRTSAEYRPKAGLWGVYSNK